MAPLTQHHSSAITKVLLIGDSGSGKTGSLASLVQAGYSLRILDFDNGTDILKNLLSPDLQKKVDVEIFTDDYRIGQNNALIPKSASAWPKAIKCLSDWPGLGPIEKWTSSDVLVLDSLNFAGKAALRFIQQLNSHLGSPPNWDDYREAQRLVENLTAMLYSTAIKCNVVCLSHIREIGKKEDILSDNNKVRSIIVAGSEKGFPETGTGQALSPTIGRYFNAVLMADIVGQGAGVRRLIRTQPHLNIGLKNSAPGRVKPEYPLANGLAEYFSAVRGEPGKPVPGSITGIEMVK